MPEKIFGLPMWAALLTLGAAGVVGYLIFFKGQGGSSSSSSGAGSTYSQQALAVMQNPDESATMALQNQLLSEIGTSVNTGFSSVGTSLSTIQGQQTQDINSNLSYYNSLTGSMRDMWNSLQTQINANAQQIMANNANLSQDQAQAQAMQNMGITSSMRDMWNSLQTQINADAQNQLAATAATQKAA